MTRYVRNQFTDPAPEVAVATKIHAKHRSTAAVQGRTQPLKRRVIKKAFYSDEEDESDEEIVAVETKPDLGALLNGKEGDADDAIDPDHRLILQSSLPLLKSRNSGVVLGVCSLHYYCGNLNTATMQQVGKALVRILRTNREVQYVVLNCINTMARDRPQMFRPFLSEFFVKSTDPVFNRLLKLEILSCLCEKENVQTILKELQLYIKDGNVSFVCAVVRAVAKVADADPSVSDNCMTGIMHLLLCSKHPEIISESVVSLRQLLQQNTQSSTSAKILKQLIKLLIMENGIEEATARSSIIWLVGEFHESVPKLSGDVLRILASEYITESTETKMQIMNLAIKLALHLPENEHIQSLMTYVLEMSRYDTNTDLRDRARFMTAIMGLAPAEDQDDDPATVAANEAALATLAEHAKAIVLAPKLPPVTLLGSADIEGIPNFTVGSLSAMVGHNVAGFEAIPAWPVVQPDASVRDAVRHEQTSSSSSAKKMSAHAEVDSSSDSDNGDPSAFSKFKNKSTASQSSRSSSDSDSDSDSDSSDSDSDSDSDDNADDANSRSSESKSSSTSGSDSDSSDNESDSSSQSDSDDSADRRRKAKSNGKATRKEKESTRPTTSLSSSLITPVNPVVPQTVTRAPIRKVQGAKPQQHQHLKDHVEDLTLFSSSAALTAPAVTNLPTNGTMLDLLSASTIEDTSNSLLGLSLGSDIPVKHGNNTAGVSVATVDSDDSSNDDDKFLLKPAKNSMPLANASILSAFGTATANSSASAPSAVNPSGAMSTMMTGSGSSALSSSQQQQQENLSEEKVILRPDLGAGLSVTTVYRRQVLAIAYPGAQCIYLIVRNTKETPLRRVRINFPTDVRKTTIPEIPLLGPGQEVRLPVEIALTGLSGTLTVFIYMVFLCHIHVQFIFRFFLSQADENGHSVRSRRICGPLCSKRLGSSRGDLLRHYCRLRSCTRTFTRLQ